MSLLRLVFVLFSCFTGAVRTNEKSKKTRDLSPTSSFDHQLLDNVVSSCHKLLVEKSVLSYAPDGIIEVIPSVPSTIEQTAYTRLPTTKTRANAALAKGEVLGVSKVESWRKSDNNWQLPRDHIRNDKDRCVNASIASSQRTTLLYQVKLALILLHSDAIVMIYDHDHIVILTEALPQLLPCPIPTSNLSLTLPS